MLIARIIVSVLYAALLLVAVFITFKKDSDLDVVMLGGALSLLAANLFTGMASVVIAAVALLIIHIAAYLNGKKYGKLSLSHHVSRLVVSAVTIALFLLCAR